MATVTVLDTIKSIILDFQETRLETGVPRRVRIEPVRGKAAVWIGVRRSGKSTYMFQVIQRLLDTGGRTIEVVPAWRYLLALPDATV